MAFEVVRELSQQSLRAQRDAKADHKADSAASPVVVGTAAIKLDCKDCGLAFSFALREQAHYEAKGFAKPTRCLACRKARRAAGSGSTAE